ncbi:MAG: FAD-dependent oxidoreductase [Coriobacteriales bacterium]|jgi:succinate dehydrogenase/fumarate reductase flavoprotein subunit|nr:FAD-dependent oxidoreductase [Coriobacteriales bacterium]
MKKQEKQQQQEQNEEKVRIGSGLTSEQERLLSRRGFITGIAAAGAITALTSVAACAPSSGGGTGTGGGSGDGSALAGGGQAATGAYDWLGTEPQIDVAEIGEMLETEVLVVGGGTAGLFAACSAAENGGKVLVIDKYTSGGIRNDLGAVNSRYQQETGTVIDPHEIVREAYHYSAGRIVPDLHYLWTRESGAAIDWYGDRLAERGVTLWHEFTTEKEPVHYKHFATGHSPEWPRDEQGQETLNGATVLTDYATGLGVEFRYNTPMVKLVKTDDRVSGVIAQAEGGGYVQINASKGVIVCTGGYAENFEMLKALQPEQYNLLGWASFIPGATGDGIKACIWAGAAFDDVRSTCSFDRCAMPVGTAPTGPESGGTFFWLGEQPFLKVNSKGERFTNESGVYDFIAHAASKQPERAYVTIWDANYQDDIVRFDMHGCSRTFLNDNGAPPDIPLPVATGMVDGLIADGFTQTADTIEELAEKLKLPADAFKKTIDRYNELYDAGKDEDYDKEPFRLSAVRQPPFYGTWTAAYILSTLDGIHIDTDMRALDEKGEPIDGLYVVGNDSGGYYAHTYFNLSTGHACGRSVTFGRRAGKIVATS